MKIPTKSKNLLKGMMWKAVRRMVEKVKLERTTALTDKGLRGDHRRGLTSSASPDSTTYGEQVFRCPRLSTASHSNATMLSQIRHGTFTCLRSKTILRLRKNVSILKTKVN